MRVRVMHADGRQEIVDAVHAEMIDGQLALICAAPGFANVDEALSTARTAFQDGVEAFEAMLQGLEAALGSVGPYTVIVEGEQAQRLWDELAQPLLRTAHHQASTVGQWQNQVAPKL